MRATSSTSPSQLPFTGDAEADALLAQDPVALLIGFVLDQQVTLQKAFSGPLELRRRVGTLDPKAIAAMAPDVLDAAFRERPALHRFPGNMARRTQELCAALAERYDGDATRIWADAGDAKSLYKRLLELPGIGEMKAGTLIGILAQRYGVQPSGWQDVAPKHMTLADVDSAESARYQEGKRAHKAELRAQGKG